MAVKTLILGESGTGKSTSLRNFEHGEVCYINPAKKPLPFKGKFDSLTGTTDIRKISKFIRESNKKIVIVDDGQYIMSFPYMQRLKETGWDKYNDIQSDYFQLIDLADNLPDDVTVYFLSHLQVMEDGRQKIKTIGKMLDEKITIEGMFTTVLKTYVSDGKYFFVTQNSGSDTVKSPLGMFPTFAIDNDLKYVDEKIRNYYEIGDDFKTDEEMAQADELVKNEEIQKPTPGKRKGRSKDKEETPVERVSRKKKDQDQPAEDETIKVEVGDPIPFDEVPESEFQAEPKQRKSRKKSEEV
ncbi:AAA family ATPase [Clostridium chromiireducens]|uniref:AAA family ATPase n=1 Tax=Clostridium chromiireducens TaxID=225345 RepID=UPI003AF41EDF